MISRCEDPILHSYPDYGGRGIKVCERWRLSFQNFLRDMGPRPQGQSIERVDVNGDYEPSNCIWATRTQQGRNKRSNHRVTFSGESKPISEWAEGLGVGYHAIWRRLKRGMSPELALSQKDLRLKGSDVKSSKLTDEIVRNIRKRRKHGEKQKSLASEYSVSNRLIYLICTRKAWAHVK